MGEWTCQECTYINKDDLRCQMCGSGKDEYMNSRDMPPQTQQTSWDCPACTYINRGHRSTCEICESPRDVESTPALVPMPQPQPEPHIHPSYQTQEPQAPCIGWSPNVAPSKERRIVAIGRTGSGKSTTCNNILGSDVFKSDTCGQSVTVQCQRATCDRFDRNIQIIDTPGLFDTGMSNAETTREIVKCVGMTAPGPHAFVMIIRIDRFTKEEQDTVEHFKQVFGEGMMRHLLVLFTRKDDLIHNGKTIHQYLQSVPPPLRELLQACDNRYIAFNNRGTQEERDRDVQDLLNQIDRIFLNNGGQCYTSEMYKEAEKAMLKREEELKKMHEAKVNHQKQMIEQECEKKIASMQRAQEERVSQLMEELRIKEEDKEKQHELEMMKLELEREKMKMEKELELERQRAEIEAEKRKAACEANPPNYREEARQEVNKGQNEVMEILKVFAPLILGPLMTFGMEKIKESITKPKVTTSHMEQPTSDDRQTEKKPKTQKESSPDLD